MTLASRLNCTLGSFHLDVDLQATTGEVIAILGPNGAGKSTILRCLAGLQPIDEGSIFLDGTLLDDGDRTFVAPEHRAVGVVFQNYRLFPNLSVLENVAFGLRARGTPARLARQQAGEWLDRVDLSTHANDRPGNLSGGQAQRVALARALAIEPRLLLLDEPLAALDVATRAGVRRELRRHLATFAGVRILITHDPIDAYALADRVVIVEDGRVVQEGTLTEVTARPTSRYVADLVGVNLIAGVAANGTLTTAEGAIVQTADELVGPAFAIIQPRSIALYRNAPDGSPRNVWLTTVADIDTHSHRVRLDGPLPLIAEITLAALEALALQPGDRVWASVKATEIATYPA